ncbi:AI-2E family transporter [Methanocaldococcus sp.]
MRYSEFKIIIKILAAALIMVFIYIVFPFIDVFAYSVAFSYMALPIYNFLRRFFNPSVSSFLSISLFIVPIVLVTLYSLFIMFKLLASINFDSIINFIQQYNYIDINYLSTYSKYFEGFITSLISTIPQKILDLSYLALKLIMIIFITYYFLKDRDKVKRAILKITPTEYEREIEIFMYYLDEIYKNLFISCVTLSIIVGILAYVLYFIFSLPYPELLALLTALFALLPIIGAWMVYIPAALYLSIYNPIKGLILALLSFIFLNIVPDYILRPYIVSKDTDIHPVFIVIAFLISPLTLGLAGFALGPIIVGLIYAFYLAKYRDKKI